MSHSKWYATCTLKDQSPIESFSFEVATNGAVIPVGLALLVCCAERRKTNRRSLFLCGLCGFATDSSRREEGLNGAGSGEANVH